MRIALLVVVGLLVAMDLAGWAMVSAEGLRQGFSGDGGEWKMMAQMGQTLLRGSVPLLALFAGMHLLNEIWHHGTFVKPRV
ncbi:MAG: hypothetical protein VCC00_15455 [Deltaproteobacteria bacterium]